MKAKEINKLQKENEQIRKDIRKILNSYMMSEEVESTSILINALVENEIEQELLSNE